MCINIKLIQTQFNTLYSLVGKFNLPNIHKSNNDIQWRRERG